MDIPTSTRRSELPEPIARALQAMREEDWDSLAEVLHPDVVWHLMGTPGFSMRGRDNYLWRVRMGGVGCRRPGRVLRSQETFNGKHILELEDTIAMLEGGSKALAFCSGMAAISCVIKLFEHGDTVFVSDDLYGGTHRLFQDVYATRYGITFAPVDFSDLDSVRAALSREDAVKAFFVETPTNPMMKVADITELARIAHERNALLIVDNTFLTCYFQRPLELGADLVVYSGTKYLCGHNDVICGFVVVRPGNEDDPLLERVFMDYMSEGDALSPFDAWLMLRSLKTLPLRLDAQQRNAQEICAFLKTHPHVHGVRYVGDPDHPAYDLMRQQASGFGAMISFYTDTPERAERVLEQVRLITFAESLGGVESLITYPAVQTHGSVPADVRDQLGITDTLLRLSVGIENARDLIADLRQALD